MFWPDLGRVDEGAGVIEAVAQERVEEVEAHAGRVAGFVHRVEIVGLHRDFEDQTRRAAEAAND